MASPAEWHGTVSDLVALRSAITRNCTCEWDATELTYLCPPHTMLEDQKIMDHMVYAVGLRLRLQASEMLGRDNSRSLDQTKAD